MPDSGISIGKRRGKGTEGTLVRSTSPVYREWFQFDTRVRPLQGLAELTHQGEREGLRFRTMAGYAFNRIDRTRPRDRSLGEATEVDLFRPRDAEPARTIEEDILFVTEETIHGLYLQEFLEFDDSFRLLAGVRLDLVDGLYRTDILPTSRTEAAAGTPTERSHSPVTFRPPGSHRSSPGLAAGGDLALVPGGAHESCRPRDRLRPLATGPCPAGECAATHALPGAMVSLASLHGVHLRARDPHLGVQWTALHDPHGLESRHGTHR